MEKLVNSDWRKAIQWTAESHSDVEIVCSSPKTGSLVRCQASSILLSAYSSVLRKTFISDEEDSALILCPDFSQECVETTLHFLIYGQSKWLNEALAEEVYFFCQSLSITGFTIDGYKPVALKAANTSKKSVFEREARVTLTATPGLKRLANLDGITISSKGSAAARKRKACETESAECDTVVINDDDPPDPLKNYFVQHDEKMTRCKLCDAKVPLKAAASKQSISPAKRHLLRYHLKIYKELFADGGNRPKKSSERLVNKEAKLENITNDVLDDPPLMESDDFEDKDEKEEPSFEDDKNELKELWMLFEVDSRRNFVVCKTCSERVPLGTRFNTSSKNSGASDAAKDHLRRRHAQSYRNLFLEGIQPRTVLSREDLLKEVANVTASRFKQRKMGLEDKFNIACPVCNRTLNDKFSFDSHLLSHVKEEIGRYATGATDLIRPMYRCVQEHIEVVVHIHFLSFGLPAIIIIAALKKKIEFRCQYQSDNLFACFCPNRKDWFENQTIVEIPADDYQCEICGLSEGTFATSRAAHLKAHYDEAQSGSAQECQTCGDSQFTSFVIYLKHCRSHGNICYLCGVPVRGARNYLTHLMVHINIEVYPEEPNSFNKPPVRSVKAISSSGEIKCPYCSIR